MPIVDGLLDEGISVQLKFLEEEVKRDRYARANAATTLARLATRDSTMRNAY
mgnify:CR=1 FL=1